MHRFESVMCVLGVQLANIPRDLEGHPGSVGGGIWSGGS